MSMRFRNSSCGGKRAIERRTALMHLTLPNVAESRANTGVSKIVAKAGVVGVGSRICKRRFVRGLKPVRTKDQYIGNETIVDNFEVRLLPALVPHR